MSWRAASAAQTSRNAEATTAAPKTAMATGGARWTPERRRINAGSATARAIAIRDTSGGRRLRGETRLAVLLQHAAIHHHRQAGFARPLRRGLVDHALLH